MPNSTHGTRNVFVSAIVWFFGLLFSGLMPKVSKDGKVLHLTSAPPGLNTWVFFWIALLLDALMNYANVPQPIGFLIVVTVGILLLLVREFALGLTTTGFIFGAAIIFVLVIWIAEKEGNLPVVKEVSNWVLSFQGTISSGGLRFVAYAFAAFFIFPCYVAAIWGGRFSTTGNDISWLRRGEGDRAIAGVTETVMVIVPDWLDFFLGFGAVTIIIRNNSTNREIRIDNVWFGWFFRHWLHQIRRQDQATGLPAHAPATVAATAGSESPPAH